MVSALAHTGEQLVDKFSKAALILDLKIKPLGCRKIEGGGVFTSSLSSLSPACTNDHGL